MIIDACNEFFVHQSLAAAATSRVVDLGVGGSGATMVPLLMQITKTAVGAGSAKFVVEGSNNKDFSASVVLADTGDVAAAKLKMGFRFPLQNLPKCNLRYVRLKLVSTGITAGTVSAALVLDIQDCEV